MSTVQRQAPSIDKPHDDRLARRTTFILSAAQALGGAILSINIAVATLAGANLLDEDKKFATLPATMMLFGTMCSTVFASLLSEKLGRRVAFIIGTLIGASGGFVAAIAIIQHSFALLLLGTFLTGSSGAFIQQYRFAAADQASPEFRPKAVSWVLAGGILAGVIGPQTAIFTQALIPDAVYAGTFFAQVVLCLAVIPILMLLRIPRPKPKQGNQSEGRPLGALMSSFPFMTAVICGMMAYSTMSLLMTAAPLAMQGYQHSMADSSLGIQWHVIAMFGPSFVTGSLIARFGVERILLVGFALLAASAAVGYAGTSVAHFWTSLILLGVGWNFGFIGGTTMLTKYYRPEEQSRAQAFNDLLIFSSVAIASLSSGVLLELVGWRVLMIVAVPMVLLPVCLLAIHHLRGRGAATQPAN